MHTRYLCIIVDKHFSWNQHLKVLKKKLSTANGLLAKTRYILSLAKPPKNTFAMFESHLRYGCQMWGQQKVNIKLTLMIFIEKQLKF